jgi:hypothetical protein
MNSNTPNQVSGSEPAAGSGAGNRFSELASDALRYWEPRRLLYNLVLSAVVLVHIYASWPGSRAFITRDNFFGLFLLAVLANIVYCVCYLVDLFVQFSGLRAAWVRWRWTILAIGIVFSAVIAHFLMLGILGT